MITAPNCGPCAKLASLAITLSLEKVPDGPDAWLPEMDQSMWTAL